MIHRILTACLLIWMLFSLYVFKSQTESINKYKWAMNTLILDYNAERDLVKECQRKLIQM